MIMVTTYNTSYSTSTANPAAVGGIIGTLWIIILIVAALTIVPMWKVFKKAGQPGWAALIPFYNTYIMIKIAGRPDWFLLLFFIPFVNIIAAALVLIDLAKAFGKSTTFAIFGLLLFPVIGWMILAFGNATYKGPTSDAIAPPLPMAPVPPDMPPTI